MKLKESPKHFESIGSKIFDRVIYLLRRFFINASSTLGSETENHIKENYRINFEWLEPLKELKLNETMDKTEK